MKLLRNFNREILLLTSLIIKKVLIHMRTPISSAHSILVQGILAKAPSFISKLLLFYRSILEEGKIAHNSAMGVFTVVGTKGKAHAVKNFPKVSCTCPSNGQCYHILAVKMSIGMEEKQSHGRINLTQLRRNTRQRRNKKSGSKTQADNLEITNAPDALIVGLIMYCSLRIH